MNSGVIKARIFCIETGEKLTSVDLSGVPSQSDFLSLTAKITDRPAQYEVKWVDHVITDANDGGGHDLVLHVEKFDDL